MTMVLIAIVWFGSLLQEAQSPSLVRARQLEHVSHEPEQAIESYRGVVDDADGGQGARGEAALGLVRCLLKLGKSDEAVAMVGRLPATIGLPALAAQLEALVASYQPSAPAQDAASFQERVQALLQALDTNQAEQAKGTLRDLGEPVVPYLLAAVRTNRNEQVLTSALELLAQQARANAAGKAAEFFVGLDQEADPILVGKALNQLSGSLPERLWPTLRKLANSELTIVKKPLITIMARRGDEESVRFVQRMMDDPDEAVRARAISTGLKILPEAEAIALARKIFREGDRIRQHAALDAVVERQLYAGVTAAFESREVSVSWRALTYTRSDQHPRLDLGSLTADQRRAVVEPASRTLRDSAIGDDDVHDLLENSNILERLPFTAAALAPLATERGGQVPELIAGWVARHIEEPGALEVAIQLGADRSLAPVIVEKSHRNSTLATHRLMLALIQRHGWQDAWTAKALLCLWRNWDDASSEACRMILAQPDAELRTFLVAVTRDDRRWVLKGGLSTLSPDSDALVERLASGEFVPIADLVANLPTGTQLLQHSKIIEVLARVYDQPHADVTRLRAIHMLKSSGAKQVVLDRLLAPIAFPNITDHNVWYQDYRDEQPELKGQSQVSPDAVRSVELRSIVRVAFSNADTLVADVERFLSVANPSTREQLASFVLAHATDVVKRERPALREGLDTRLLAVLDQPDCIEAVSGAAMDALQQLHDAEGWSDETIARLLRSPHRNVAIGALQLVLDGHRAVHRVRVEELLASAPDSTVRFNAVPVVAAYGDVAAAKALAEALRDPSDGVRGTAKAALESLRLYLDEKARWEQFASRGESALTPLTALVKQTRDSQKKVRLAAIRALGAFGDQAALPHLIELLKDPDSDVQSAAEKALDALSTVRRAGS